MRILVSLLLITLTGAVYADGEAEFKYRQGIFRSVGGHMTSMAAILRGQVHVENLALHANAMKDVSRIVPTVFPEGSGVGESEALPAIWEEPDDFRAALDKFVTAADGMAAAAESGDPSKLGPAIQALGGSCKNCHDNFRAE